MRNFFALCFVVVYVAANPSSGLAEDKSDAQDILQRAIKAVGGEQAILKLKTPLMWMERGTFYGMGDGIPFVAQYAAKWPNWYRQEIENAFTITTNGDAAWVSSPNGTNKLSAEMFAERLTQVRVAWVERLFPLLDKAYTLSTIDSAPIDGRATVAIKANHSDGRDVIIYFDQENCLIAKIETTVISPQLGPKPVKSEAYFSSHQSFGGVMMPSKFRWEYDGKLFMEGETLDYKIAATLDPEQFKAPE